MSSLCILYSLTALQVAAAHAAAPTLSGGRAAAELPLTRDAAWVVCCRTGAITRGRRGAQRLRLHKQQRSRQQVHMLPWAVEISKDTHNDCLLQPMQHCSSDRVDTK